LDCPPIPAPALILCELRLVDSVRPLSPPPAACPPIAPMPCCVLRPDRSYASSVQSPSSSPHCLFSYDEPPCASSVLLSEPPRAGADHRVSSPRPVAMRSGCHRKPLAEPCSTIPSAYRVFFLFFASPHPAAPPRRRRCPICLRPASVALWLAWIYRPVHAPLRLPCCGRVPVAEPLFILLPSPS